MDTPQNQFFEWLKLVRYFVLISVDIKRKYFYIILGAPPFWELQHGHPQNQFTLCNMLWSFKGLVPQ